MTTSHGAAPSPFKQPRAVWAVAFACVVSFMGIGLVDPILPALAGSLHATPSQVSLLFTSYLVVTAVAMLVVGWVSSRIGAKRTLVVGLVLIVVFAALAGTSDSIGGIVALRAGWGLGNALFIATSLAVIVASAPPRLCPMIQIGWWRSADAVISVWSAGQEASSASTKPWCTRPGSP